MKGPFVAAIAALLLVGAAGCKTETPPPPAGGSLAPLPPDPRRGAPEPAAPVVEAVRSDIGKSRLPGNAVDGSKLNRFFPKDSAVDRIVFLQEKRGTVLAELRQGKAVVAQISITDAAANPSLRAKFASPSGAIAGYPAAGNTERESAILVADRYQVKVRSMTETFTDQDREAILGRFDLGGLTGLK